MTKSGSYEGYTSKPVVPATFTVATAATSFAIPNQNDFTTAAAQITWGAGFQTCNTPPGFITLDGSSKVFTMLDGVYRLTCVLNVVNVNLTPANMNRVTAAFTNGNVTTPVVLQASLEYDLEGSGVALGPYPTASTHTITLASTLRVPTTSSTLAVCVHGFAAEAGTPVVAQAGTQLIIERIAGSLFA